MAPGNRAVGSGPGPKGGKRAVSDRTSSCGRLWPPWRAAPPAARPVKTRVAKSPPSTRVGFTSPHDPARRRAEESRTADDSHGDGEGDGRRGAGRSGPAGRLAAGRGVTMDA